MHRPRPAFNAHVCRCDPVHDGHRASGVGHRASGVGHRASGVGHRASGIGRSREVAVRRQR
ncbi:hypothetical protein DF045_13335 [Burkholderia cepacia]|nr:hypothetical protein DF045_13335 [Burkholderia cepacia]